MFKKPLGNLKTSAPLRSSDRRKLKDRVVNAFKLTQEEGDTLVPDGILSTKFSTHVDEHGIAYISPSGDPLWFSIGKGSDDLIPTIYTCWKKEDLLPFLSTPAAVIPILVGGADLMIPGVIHCPPSLDEGRLVCIRQYVKKDSKPALSPPLAIGRMALQSDELRARHSQDDVKGKAVYIAHTWKDHLWDMGTKKDIPPDTFLEAFQVQAQENTEDSENKDRDETATLPPSTPPPGPSDPGTSSSVSYTPQEVTELLNKALLQAISKTLRQLPSSSFPIPATLLYTNHILPNRPAFPTLVIKPSSSASSSSTPNSDPPQITTEITIKTSSHKSLTTFLKASEKAGLLTLKPPQKQQPDVLITAVNGEHPVVSSHVSFATVRDVEATAAKKAKRDEKEREDREAKAGEVDVKELWKPHQATVDVFEAFGVSKSDLYTQAQIRTHLANYISSKNLVNQRDQGFINLDDVLYSCVLSSKGKGKKGKEVEEEPPSKFMRRDELQKAIQDKMQNWYEVRAEGRDIVTKKGTLTPIQVVMKVRQGRKASTLITGFEPFLVVDAEEMAEELRKTCAGATSVSPAAGKPAGSGFEVLIQGKQSKAVLEYLLGKGIPKKWIEVSDLSGKK